MTRLTAAGLMRGFAAITLCLLNHQLAHGQTVTHRGFIEGEATGFFEEAINDPERRVGDVLAREEVFFRAGRWFELGTGVDFRANSHSQVEDDWRFDVDDRATLRPRLALRRLSATFVAGGFTLDVGKQFIRWGRADVINPTDRFAPRDYLNVHDAEVLPVIAVRPAIQLGEETIEAIATLQPTPSRLPLFDQRWAPLPGAARTLTSIDLGTRLPDDPQYGVRWRHTGTRLESAVAYLDGVNHLPNIETRPLPDVAAFEFARVFPKIRMLGGDVALPGRWLTLKLETAYVTSPRRETEEYVLYVVEVERQIGEWLIDVGYAGDVTTEEHPVPAFSPDRGMARSIIGRAAYTVDPQRSLIFEGAVRQNGDGVFAKADYSQSFGQHLRLTLSGILITGDESDFIGQFQHNSHVAAGLRFSF